MHGGEYFDELENFEVFRGWERGRGERREKRLTKNCFFCFGIHIYRLKLMPMCMSLKEFLELFIADVCIFFVVGVGVNNNN